MSEQKLIEALEQIANLDYVGTDKAVAAVRMAAEIAREALAAPAEPSGSSGALPAGEQVGLTEGGLLAALNDAAKSLATISNFAGKDDFLETMLDVRGYARSRANVAADEVNRHIEAKRASCSRTAKTSTHEGGRVDETGKSEHVGGAA